MHRFGIRSVRPVTYAMLYSRLIDMHEVIIVYGDFFRQNNKCAGANKKF